jgi:hypothetical protein
LSDPSGSGSTPAPGPEPSLSGTVASTVRPVASCTCRPKGARVTTARTPSPGTTTCSAVTTGPVTGAWAVGTDASAGAATTSIARAVRPAKAVREVGMERA